MDELIEALVELNEAVFLSLIGQKLNEGHSAIQIITDGVIPGLNKVGQRYERMEYFLSELLFAADLMKKGMEILDPLLEKDGETTRVKGKILTGTVKGDMHDLGKNIFVTIVQASGFEVQDLGVDVTSEQFVKKAEEFEPDIIGMSALLSTTAPYFETVITALKEAGLRDRVFIMIGGPPLVAAEEVGADAYCNNAFEGKKIAEEYIRSIDRSIRIKLDDFENIQQTD